MTNDVVLAGVDLVKDFAGRSGLIKARAARFGQWIT